MVIFLNADGSCQKVTPEHVYQGSNNVNDITVIAPYAQSTALLIGFVLPNGLYWESSDGSRYVPMDYVPQSVDGNVGAWHYNLRSSVTELMGDLYVAINAVTAQGNTTSYMCRIIIEESVLPNLPSEPEPDVYDLILKYLGRVQGSLVAVVEKVPGTSNAIRYIDNFGAISSPIVIGGGADVPIPVNAASTIKVPKEAFAAVEGGYSYTVTAGIHGQMRDGAVARDLWVSFDEAEEAAFKGAYEDYTVNEAGDITITVTTPVDLTVRVWNGKGLVDEVARADIAAETERAEAEENRLQEQITELRNTGVDVVARADIAVLKEDVAAEVERAENAEGVLASDIQGLREDITNEAHFRGYLETNAEIEALSGTPNDYAYSAESGTVWIYQTETGWTDSGKTVPDQFTPASTSVPLMDGVGSAGVTEEYARGDHRHPSDTNKLDKSGGTMTGLLKLANDGLRSGNEEYGVQVDRYLNFHALNNANSWGVFNQQNEQVFQVAYQTKKVRVNGELEENGQRVYSPNNPPPSGATTNIITLTEISGTLSEEQSATVIDNPSNVLFYYQNNYYALSAKNSNVYTYSNARNNGKSENVSSIAMTYSTSTNLLTLNGISGKTKKYRPRLSANALAVNHIKMKRQQYFTLYLAPFNEFMKGAYISNTVGEPIPYQNAPYNGKYFTTLETSTDDSVSKRLSGAYTPWNYYGFINNGVRVPLPNNAIGDINEPFVDSTHPNNMGYMAIAEDDAPWTLRIGGYAINAPGVSNTNNVIIAQPLNIVPYEEEPKGQGAATAIMFTALGAVQNATVFITVLDGVNKAGAPTLSVTYTFNITIE